MAITFITGTSSGIGRLTAETLARGGHTVYATMRDRNGRNREAGDALTRLAKDQNLAIRVLDVDVQDESAIQDAVDEILRETTRIDIVVNNAGLMSIGLAEGFTEAQAAQQMDVNFLGPVRVCRAVLPHLRAQGVGLLIHVTSIVGRLLFPGCAFYCASKFAHEAYAEVLHYELKGTGVESVIVEPGPYPSRLLPNSPAPQDVERLAGYGEVAALRDRFVKHFGDFFSSPEAPDTQEVADAILRLAQMPQGTRPIRTVCGVDFGADELNRVMAPFQAGVLRGLGLESMIPSVVTERFGKASA
jgi:NAD(P)-dependent dehydrogenase (short-subunit alcohol dehydrogenase family)